MKYKKYKGGYDASRNQAYRDAVKRRDQHAKKKPTYAGTYEGQLDELYQQIVNRPKFHYDQAADPLYQQQRQLAMQQGQMAMQNTMGQAAHLTGGYGSSYSQQVGQQAYNGYLQELDKMAPQFAAAAQDRYAMELSQLQDQYGMLGGMRDREYGAYQDALGHFQAEQGRLDQMADNAYNRGAENYWNTQNQKFQREQFDYQKEQDRLNREQAYALAMMRASNQGGGGGDEDDEEEVKVEYGPGIKGYAGGGRSMFDRRMEVLQGLLARGDTEGAQTYLEKHMYGEMDEQQYKAVERMLKDYSNR